MWPVPANSTTVAAVATNIKSSSSSPEFLLKDGREIRVGDCALFKPPKDSPPFIGIIRKFTGGEDCLSLGVNWLYRPSDVKLGKGISLEAAPNEVFYTFHKDEIPAASLLHPCKVAFLYKGVELPSGISSFVCRRVYDSENKCLWWLTDKGYINERQDEVDKLLDKTRLEMHGVMQSGGRSPKPLNGPTATTQLKPSSDSVQNSSSFSSQVKGKKRERGDQGYDPAKRERLSKPEDVDSGHSRTEHMLKSEIAKITEKGALVDFEGVEKLVKLMQPDSPDKKIDLASRVMLVDVIAVTDRVDCLGRFVQLKGLPVLDEWLQEVHRGKIGDVSSPKESEKSVEEFLLVLLRALDKLPVNLHALQTCNVGKSVNHLRTHKNSEIQKKARSLVDTWKKRVEAEMTMNDAKSAPSRGVSWPSKPAPSEVSHVGNRKSLGSVEAAMRSSVTQSSASKSPQVKLGAGESVAKTLPGSVKAVTTSGGGNLKDPHFRMLVGTGTSDLPLTPIKEERSSSSSQSQNNSQSCSSDHAKTVASSCREDARSSTAGSVTVSKSSSGASHHRKSSNGVHGSAISGVQKETVSGKVSSSNKNLISEKSSPTGVSHDKLPDIPLDYSNNQRLIVRLPNTGCSPSRGASGGSLEDPAVLGGGASPPAEKYDNPDRRLRARCETLRSHIIPSTNSDLGQGRDGLGGSSEANVLTACDERQKTSEDGEKIVEASKSTGKLLGILPRSRKSYEASLSSINALVESCVKFSEAGGSTSPEDDVGMNLLASVAAGEILKSDNVSPLASPHRNSPGAEESCSGNDGKLRDTGEEVTQIQFQPHDGDGTVTSGTAEQCNASDTLQAKNDLTYSASPMLTNFSGDSKVTSVGCEEKKGKNSAVFNSSAKLQQTAEVSCLRSNLRSGEITCDASVAALPIQGKNESCSEVESDSLLHEHRKSVAQRGRSGSLSDCKPKVRTHSIDDDRKADYVDEKTLESSVAVPSELAAMSAKVEKEVNEKLACSSMEMVGQKQNTVDKESTSGTLNEQKPSYVAQDQKDSLDEKSEDACLPSLSANILHVESKSEMPDDLKAGVLAEQSERPTAGLGSFVSDHKGECAENSERKEVPGESASHVELATVPMQENKPCEMSSGYKMDGVESEVMEERFASSANVSVSSGGSGMAVKLDFDLNEGFPVDDGNQGEVSKSVVPNVSSTTNLPCPLPIPISTICGSFATSITVAAAAKGSFFPPENPMRSKGGELGWKGSASTSAFRPAEPRKNLEMSLNTLETPVDTASSKQSRLPLDFDLNVPDERVLEDVPTGSVSCSESGARDRVAGGLDLDLNRVDESPDTVSFLVSNSSRFEIPAMPSRTSLPGGLSNGALCASRDFDLNNGPGLDEVGTETAPRNQPIKSSLPFQSSLPVVRMNGADFGKFSSSFPPANSYSAITVPSIFPGRGEQSYVPAAGSQRILAPPSASTALGPEMYRGPMFSSSPAVPFPSPASFQYPGFPFETSFPLPSNAFSGASTAYGDSSSGGALGFPTIPSQLVGPAGVVSAAYPRPYVMSVPGGTITVGSDSRKWGGQLDLNAGPGGSDTERRDERFPSAIRQQHSVSGSQAPSEEQMKMYQVPGEVASSIFKRKEPDGGWDGADRFSYKQSPWQ